MASKREARMHVKDLFDLSGKVALVTGGSRGLGKEIATGLGQAGAVLAITARRASWLQQASTDLAAHNIDCLALESDVSQPEQVSPLVSEVLKRFGKIDILVNNAGITWASPAEEMPLEKWKTVLDVNLTGCFLMAQAVAKLMIRQGAGKIINIASVSGLIGTPAKIMDTIGYSASKGAVISLTRDLAVKWAPHRINVNAIAPGFFPTRLSEKLLEKVQSQVEARIPLGRVGREDELKGVAVFLASAASDYITGQVIVVDGGLTAC
jgi:NAD(P)-dependent dehydrogenase (short-subunit alcohol dehydrogenase family)